MKVKIILSVLLTTILFISCKNEKSESVKNEVQQEEIDNRFNVTLDVTVKKDDNFQVYYNTGSGITEEQSEWAAVKGADVSQKIVFRLPEGVIPNSVRIDLGVNDKQEDVILNGVEMNYKGNKFLTNSPDLGKFFYPLEPSEIDFTTGKVKIKMKDGKRIEPAFYSNAALEAEIKKIIK